MSLLETNATDTHVTRFDLETLRSPGSNVAKVPDVSATAAARRCLPKPWAVTAALPDPTFCDFIADLGFLTVGRPVAGKM